MPFNVYLYASPKSTSTIEQPQKFIDEDVFTVLKKDIDAFLLSIDNPQEYRNYRLYMTCLNMLEIIEKYQIKRNDSPAFSISNKNTYTEEANTLIDLEEYITHFPLSQMLFNRYLALSLHKNTIAIFNFEELNFDFKKKINDFFKEENDNYFISVIQISMALAYINKTIEMAEKYDNNNSIELHKSLALFDRARMEFLLEILLEINVKKYCVKNSKELLNMILELSTKPQNIDFIKKLAVGKTIKKLEKSFDYALIDFFDSVLYKQHVSSNETAFRNKFTIEMIKLISDKINSLILKEVNEEYKNIKLTENYYHSQTEPNDLNKDMEVKDYTSNLYCEPIPNSSEYYNEVNNIWRDSPYDIVIFNKSSLCKFICINCNEEESKQEDAKKSKNEFSLEQNIVHIIKNEASKLGLNIDNEIIGIHVFNHKNKHQSLKECIKEICKNEFDKIQNDLFGNLEKHIEEYSGLGGSKKWENTMINAEKIRYNMWNAARNWPPNMRSILLFEYYHALSDKYIYKINEIKYEFDSCIENENYNFTNIEGQDQVCYDKTQYIMQELLKEKLYKPLKSIIANIQKKSGNKNNLLNYYLEYLECLSKLVEIKTKLDNATNVMESNYEIPDLSYNILKKIDGVLEKENDSTNVHEKIFTFLKKANDTEVHNN